MLCAKYKHCSTNFTKFPPVDIILCLEAITFHRVYAISSGESPVNTYCSKIQNEQSTRKLLPQLCNRWMSTIELTHHGFLIIHSVSMKSCEHLYCCHSVHKGRVINCSASNKEEKLVSVTDSNLRLDVLNFTCSHWAKFNEEIWLEKEVLYILMGKE